MSIIVPDEPLRALFARLLQFEGGRCWWRVPVAAVAFVVPILLPIAIAVLAAGIAGGDFVFRTALLAAIVTAIGVSYVTPRLARRQLHRRLIADRLWRYEEPNPRTEVQVLLREGDLDLARCALRRAKLNPGVHTVRLGTPPADATDLDFRIGVHEPAACPQSESDADRARRIRSVVAAAGIRARVAGIDTSLALSATDGRQTVDRGAPTP